jgi:hypothetical protein
MRFANFTSALLVLVCGLFSLAASASSQVIVEGVNYSYACGYFSERVEQVHVTYLNSDSKIPNGTQMYLHWGVGGSTASYNGNTQVNNPIEWVGGDQAGYDNASRKADLLMTEKSPGTYEVTLQAAVHDRSEPSFFTQLKFSILQAQPGGNFYDPQGGYGHYYEVDFINNGSCVSGNDAPAMSPLAVLLKP